MKPEEIQDLDDLIFKEFQGYYPDILNSNFSNQFPQTIKLSSLLTISSNFIKNSIFNCAENDDLYGIKILFRSLIEHYLRFMYIWFNWIKYKNDDISKKYIEFNEARDKLDELKSQIAKYKLSNPESKMVTLNELIQKHPDLKKYSKDEIEKETLKYSYKNIISFLKQIDHKHETETTLLGSLIIEYSKLSAFVHGSSGSHNEMTEYSNKSERIKEYERICGLAFQMAGAVKLLSLLMLVQTDKDRFESNYLNIDHIMKKLK